MKRPMLVLWIGLVLGELIGQTIGWAGVIIPASLFMVLMISDRIMRRAKPFFIRFCLIGMTMILGIVSARHEIRKVEWMEAYARVYSNQICRVEGTILSRKETDAGSVIFRLSHVIHKTKQREIFLKGDLSLVGSGSIAENLCPGDRIEVLTTLESMESPGNPGSFNGRIYNYSNNIYMTGYFRQIVAATRPGLSVRRKAYRWKKRMEAIYQTQLKEEDAAMLKAMVLGDKSDLSREQKRLYEENGVSHLLAISGLHVSIVGGKIYRFFKKRGIGYGISSFMAAILLLFYGCMTGFGNSILRAVTMFFLFLMAQYYGMDYDLTSSMSLAGIWMLLEAPYRLFEGGFLISYAALIAIGVVIPVFHEKTGKQKMETLLQKWKSGILDSSIIFLLTAPFIMRFFYLCTPYSIFLNPLVLSGMNLLMISALLGGIFGGIFCFPALLILRIYHGMFSLVRRIPGAIFITGCPSFLGLLGIYGLESVIFLLWISGRLEKKTIQRGMFLLGSFLLFFSLWKVSDQKMQITALDVGQGDCLLIVMPDGKTMMIDGGSTTEKKVYENIIRPALYYYGISRLDYLVVTHMDEDHISGVRDLLEDGFPVSHFFSGKTQDVIRNHVEEKKKELVELARSHGSQVHFIAMGDSVPVGNASLRCLHPIANQEYLERNEESVVLFLEYKDIKALFTGDLEEKYEEEVAESLPIEITLLKVAHHGSKYSTGQSFLEKIHPQYAMISAGKKNRYGHPHKETLERLKDQKISVYKTLEGGAICFCSNGKSVEIFSWKKKHF